MAAHDDAEASLYDYMFGGDEEENNEDLPSVEEIAGMILSLDKSELRQMPEPLLQSVKIMLSESMFPEELAEKLKKKLKGL